MKKIITVLLFVVFVAGLSRADDTRYISAMKKNIEQIDSLKGMESMVVLKNSFLRIAKAEKEKWLPFYYVSYLNVLLSYADTVKTSKDAYLDEAQKYINVADSLQADESEIYVLKGMILQSRLQIDPMNRYMKYGAEMNSHLQKAMALEPANPRPDYLLGLNLLYTPEAFGGGAKVAKPMLEGALQKFENFIPKNELMPTWGKKQLENFMSNLPK